MRDHGLRGKHVQTTALQQARALLFGLALGDALGWPVEFDSLAVIKSRYGAQGIQEPPDPAIYTDDTQMTIALAEGMLDAGLSADEDAQMAAIGARFVTWLHSPENNRAPGGTCTSGVAAYESGVDWRESGVEHSKGCGAAMRVAPIGYFYQHDPERLRQMAIASSVITHRHPTGVAAAVAAAYAVKLALDGVPVSEYMARIGAFVEGMSDELDAALSRVGHAAAWGDQEAALKHIGEGWVGEEAIALALYCVIRHPDDYVACVRRGANLTGDSDSVASIAGGISAARLGLEAVPQAWRARCENHDNLEDLAARMAQAKLSLTEG
jgi:ADP-ribosylglycohydrolase